MINQNDKVWFEQACWDKLSQGLMVGRCMPVGGMWDTGTLLLETTQTNDTTHT